MKLYKTISILALCTGLVACESLYKAEGNAMIYFTGSANGEVVLTPDNVIIDKERQTMTFAFGIYRSGLQPADAFTVDCEVDNSQIPEGTVPLAEGEYMLTTVEGPVNRRIGVEEGNVNKKLFLTINEDIFIRNNGKKLALHLFLSNPSRYELNTTLSQLNIVIDVANFLGTYEDITKSVLKNYKTPFDVTLDSPPLGSCDPYQHTPTEWIVNDAVKIHEYKGKMFGGVDARCWGNRNWLSAGNYDFYMEKAILNGKIYQVVELTSGDYRVEYDLGEAAGGVGHAAVIVVKGESLSDFDRKEEEALEWAEFATTTNMNFSVDKAGKYSIGFVYNIPKGVQAAYAVSAVRIKRQISVFD